MRARIDPDEFDMAQIREAVDSPGYAAIATRIDESRAAELAKLAWVKDLEKLFYGQGMIAGLALARSVPKILVEEIKTRSAQKRKTANED